MRINWSLDTGGVVAQITRGAGLGPSVIQTASICWHHILPSKIRTVDTSTAVRYFRPHTLTTFHLYQYLIKTQTHGGLYCSICSTTLYCSITPSPASAISVHTHHIPSLDTGLPSQLLTSQHLPELYQIWSNFICHLSTNTSW